MPILYIRTGCPYSAHVLAAGEELGIAFETRNIADDGIAAELLERGGDIRTPYLVDQETGTEMYESDAIIAYLHERFSNETVT